MSSPFSGQLEVSQAYWIGSTRLSFHLCRCVEDQKVPSAPWRLQGVLDPSPQGINLGIDYFPGVQQPVTALKTPFSPKL